MNSFMKWNCSWLVSGKNTIRVLTNTNCNVYKNTTWNTSRHISTSTKCDIRSVYTISLKTGKMAGAGTDANVYIRMIGELGSTEEMKLETEVGHMERGMTDLYSVASDDVGVLKKLIVRHDNTGFGPAWFLEWVKVKDGRGTSYHFKCNEWLDKESSSTGPIKLLRETSYVNSDPSHARKHAETIASANISDHLQSNKVTKVVIKHTKILFDSSDETEVPVVDDLATTYEPVKEVEDVAESIHETGNQPPPLPGTSGESGLRTEPATSSFETDSTDGGRGSNKHASSLSPAVRYILDTFGIDIADVPGTGPYSRILKGDVLAYIAKQNVTKKGFSQMPLPDISHEEESVEVPSAFTIEQPVEVPSAFTIEQPVEVPSAFTIAQPVEVPSAFTIAQPLEELASVPGEHYLDRPLTEGYQALAQALKTGNFEVPLIHMSTSCMVDKLLKFTEAIDAAGTPSVTRNMVVTYILCQALVEAGDILASNHEQIDVLLNHDGNSTVLRDCRYAGIRDLMNQSNRDSADSVSVPRYGLNIVDMEGVSQLSSVLRIGQVLCLNVGGTRLGINTEGELTQCVTLSVSCDNRIIMEETCAVFLTIFKKYLCDPFLLQL